MRTFSAKDVFVKPIIKVPDERTKWFGNHPYYGNALMLTSQEARELIASSPGVAEFIRPLYGSKEAVSRTRVLYLDN